jgi:hypothetical protein
VGVSLVVCIHTLKKYMVANCLSNLTQYISFSLGLIGSICEVCDCQKP